MAFNIDDVWANLEKEMAANRKIVENNLATSEQVIANVAACQALQETNPLLILAAAAEVAAKNPFQETTP